MDKLTPREPTTDMVEAGGEVEHRPGITASLRCPFKDRARVAQWAAIMRDYEAKSPALFGASGDRKNVSNNIGQAFWRGLHGQLAAWIDKRTPLWVCYRAGAAIARAKE